MSSMKPSRSVYRFKFKPSDAYAIAEVEETILLSIIAIECLVGKSAVRLGCHYAFSADKRSVVIDAEDECGRMLARIFCGFCSHEYGDDSFTTKRIEGPPPEKNDAGTACPAEYQSP